MHHRQALLARPTEILVSTINLYEVGRYVDRTSGADVMEETLAHMGRCRVVPVDSQIARMGVRLAKQYRLHMADALIAATARHAGAKLLTFDGDLLRLPGARKP